MALDFTWGSGSVMSHSIYDYCSLNTFLPLKNDICDTYSSPMYPCGVCSPPSVGPYLVRLNPVNVNIQILKESKRAMSDLVLFRSANHWLSDER
jgi:hypothetical protein